MRHIILFILLFTAQDICSQVSFGHYTHPGSSGSSGLNLRSDGTFNYYDRRYPSCWIWTNYEGNWRLDKDTLIFYWSYERVEDPDTIITKNNPEQKNIAITFLYDDGDPVPNVETSFACCYWATPQQHYSSIYGEVIIPVAESTPFHKYPCEKRQVLAFKLKSEFATISSGSYYDSVFNQFTVIIKKYRRSWTVTDTKKYIICGDMLKDIDHHKDNDLLNWGDLKYLSATFGKD